MPKYRFNKLVRDKITDHQIASGGRPSFRVLTSDEHKKELVNKIIEEALEIIGAKDSEAADEIADVQQAIDDLKDLYKLDSSDITQAQQVKNDKNGTFKKGIFVDYVEVDADNKWVEYYLNNPDRYPEIE